MTAYRSIWVLLELTLSCIDLILVTRASHNMYERDFTTYNPSIILRCPKTRIDYKNDSNLWEFRERERERESKRELQ